MPVPALSDITLGLADAQAEVKRHKGFLLEGFHDLGGLSDRCTTGEVGIVLGGKGSGKSALASHLELGSATPDAPFVTHVRLSEMPLATDGQKIAEQAVSNGWQLFLQSLVASSLYSDRPGNLDGAALRDARAWLKLCDLSLDSDPPKNGVRVTSADFSALGVGISLAWADRTPVPERIKLLRGLLEAINASTPSRSHILVINAADGVASLLGHDLNPLAVLLDELVALNQRLEVPVRLLFLCNDQVYSRLRNQQSNTYRQDYGVTLRWWATNEPHGRHLVNLLDRRARLWNTSWDSLRSEWLTPPVHLQDQLDPDEYLLSFTRYIPRDVFMLLKYIGEVQREAVESGETFGWGKIQTGIERYCANHFVGEVSNELALDLDSDEIDVLWAGMKAFGRSGVFNLKRLVGRVERLDPAKVERAVRLLFSCGAVGGAKVGFGRRPDHFSFAEPNARIDDFTNLVLHQSLSIGFGQQRLLQGYPA